MKIAFFDSKKYDIESFKKYDSNNEFKYYDTRLTEDTVYLAKGYDAVCVFVNDVVNKNELSYIMGNPPFVANNGRTKTNESHSKGMQSEEQKKDRLRIFGKDGGVLDYVACWYKLSAEYIKGTNISVAFVATDSICQGQQIIPLWKGLFEDGIKIQFAYEFFKWESDSFVKFKPLKY